MADTQDQDKKDTARMTAPAKLSLTKTVEGGKVKQNFQHGRSKTVTVEVRKTRTFSTGKDGSVVAEVKRPGALSMAPRGAENQSLRNLTSDERETRLRALKIAEEESRIAAKDAGRTAPGEEEPSRARGTVVIPAGNRDSVVTAPPRDFPKDLGNTLAPKRTDVTTAPRAAKAGLAIIDEDNRTDKDAKPSKMRLRKDESRRSSGKINVNQALSLGEERMRSLASVRRQREKAKKGEYTVSTEKIVRDVVIPESITVQELANRMAERGVDVVKALMRLGVMATVNQSIDADTAELIVQEFGHNLKRVTEGDVENVLKEEVEAEEDLRPRPPVVTIMGHVDHGKTSLLDALRQTDVVAGEAGGITQHIGAYQVNLPSGAKITFLDTPGHEAFTAMRARGAKVTDIVVLVVAADDGIMAQTKEAISHAKAAGVPIIVAINKIDKPEADAGRVKNELMQYELVPEEFGGDVMTVELSAKQKLNLDKLEEAILLQSEVMELKANPARAAAGTVVEAKIDKGRGVVATLLVQRGTLKPGDIVVAGAAYGKVRAILDDKGKALGQAGPAQPVEILGLNAAPDAGDEFAVVENEKTARDITEYRFKRVRTQQTMLATRTVDNLFDGTGKNAVKELPLVIKGDVQGSVEAIAGSIGKLSGEEVSARVLHTGIGAINESDISLAQATGAIVIGFNVRATVQARELAAREKVDLRYYSVIYNVVDDVKAALSGMLSPTQRENFLGYAEIRQIFNVSKAGKVAGCMVTEGVVKRGAKVRLLRDNVVIHEGALKTLKRFKDEVKEVKSGFECGMAFENYDDIREGDMIEAFEVEEVARTI